MMATHVCSDMKLSICIPVYKVESYIEKCARSLFEQTARDLEYIFIDDCSPDGSIAKLKEIVHEYPLREAQVKIVRHEKNSGLIRARKTGLANATGELVTHCDSDDWIDPEYYEKLITSFDDPEVDMAFGPMVANDDKPIRGMWDVAFAGTPRDYFALADKIVAFNSNVNKVYRREVACAPGIEVPDPIRMAEDMCRTMQTVVRCRKIVSITGSYYHYRENRESMSRKFDPRSALNDLEAVYETIVTRVDNDLARPLLKLAARNIAFYGLKLGVFDTTEFKKWWREMKRVDARHWSDGLERKRRIFLSIAGVSFPLARLMVKYLPNNPVVEF